MYVPLMIYLGGNHVHFITGLTFSVLHGTNNSDEIMFPLGLNVDIGRHFGIDALLFEPYKYSNPTLNLDFRIIF